ncbi:MULTISPECIES: hypothetical protein [Chryseobacterium]|uniref:Uncharacterized protein n=1 Tax=Chryseobacterium camelliae TaxID=1265445 RepID=A0ABU0TGD4_9FLAO|nr:MULTISPECIES: hypothetical protein [Chryseobacterium]MDT3406086.1 hypothetical protein [Pseudacidovorax intermedius]MDQ1096113.1 hypothetical protein [Chryseobacterium camelliae]MDQ1100049.1 hypothetical protein [Chryseobacterium sp. SORGH_AS_1048]MDR6087392.1 hypothetical protein [Chryseobacterium sp. SORGH_AS_0909]MDR6131767.1 hypothetical protein [Chryseobacterium sp. SORGH_AS_1175]
MKNTISLALLLFAAFIGRAQTTGVGIGTNTPTHTLEVNGNMKLSGDLYFENPGNHTGNSADSYLLVRDNSDQVLKRYVPATARYSAINSTVYFITNINPQGLSNFDTGISSADYYVVIGGFIIRGVNNNSNIKLTQPGNTNQYIPQYSCRAFVQNGTWRIEFMPNNGRVFDQNPEIRLSVSVYRRDMLTTVNNTITVDMGANTAGTGSAPAPVLP